MRSSRLLTLAIAVMATVPLLGWTTTEGEVATAAEGCWIDDGGTVDDTTDDREFCRLDTWIHRGQTPAGNAEAVALESFPSWDTNPPAGSVTGGNGGGYVGNSVLDWQMPGDPNNAATFVGTYTGSLKNLAVSLYAWVPARTVEGTPHEIDLILEYQGIEVLKKGPLVVNTTPDGESTLRLDFAVDDLDAIAQLFGENGPDTVHELAIKVGSWQHAFDEAVYLYDTTEVPSSIVFNIEPEKLVDYTVVDAS